MNTDFQSFEKVKKMYPDEWVLFGNPEMKNTNVLGGIVLYHSKDKKEVCYVGKGKTADYNKITLAYTGDLKQSRRFGFFKRI